MPLLVVLLQHKKKNLSEVLTYLRSAYGKHSDADLLSGIAMSFRQLTDTDFAFTCVSRPAHRLGTAEWQRNPSISAHIALKVYQRKR